MVGYADLSRAYADISRRLENTLRIGKICEADYGNARLRVKSGDVTTALAAVDHNPRWQRYFMVGT